MAKIRRKLKRYPTDMTDEEWSVIAPLLPGPAKKGRPRKTECREVVNAIRYLFDGLRVEMLPSDFPPSQTVYWWFRQFVRRLLFKTIHDIALMADREPSGRASPSADMTAKPCVSRSRMRGLCRVIPSRSNATKKAYCPKRIYRQRHKIENFFCRIKDWRRIATRYDKLARNFLAAAQLVAALYWIKI